MTVILAVFGVSVSAAAVATVFTGVAALLGAITGLLALKNSRKQAEAAETTAEAAAIKAIAEATSVPIQNLQREVERLVSGELKMRQQYEALALSYEELQDAFRRVTQRLNQERKWTVRLIRALTQAGLEIPARPEMSDDDPIDTDETIALGRGDQ